MPSKTVYIERLSLPMTLASVASEKRPAESGRFRAIVSCWDSVIDTTHMLGVRSKFRRGAYAKTIRDSQSSDRARARIKILDSHRQDVPPIGMPLSLQESAEGLVVYASLNQTARALDWMKVLQHAEAIGQGGAIEASVGFDCIDFAMVEDPDDGETLREIREARLHEISLVVEGADRQTSVREAASLDVLLGRDRRDFEREREASMRRLELAEKRINRTGGGSWSCVR
jgi:HK97 family phage prohead protease